MIWRATAGSAGRGDPFEWKEQKRGTAERGAETVQAEPKRSRHHRWRGRGR